MTTATSVPILQALRVRVGAVCCRVMACGTAAHQTCVAHTAQHRSRQADVMHCSMIVQVSNIRTLDIDPNRLHAENSRRGANSGQHDDSSGLAITA